MHATASALRIGGMLVGYYLVCPRKAWLSMRGLWMEQESQAVALGRLLDEQTYQRRRKHLALEADAPVPGVRLVGKVDTADLRHGTLHETKRGRACEDAHRWQLRFYLWLLARCGVTREGGAPFAGRLQYPRLRRTEPVHLEPEHEERLTEIVTGLAQIARQDAPPPRHPRRAFCKSCAFEDLCYA